MNKRHSIQNILVLVIAVIVGGVIGYFIGTGTSYNQSASVYGIAKTQPSSVVPANSVGAATQAVSATAASDPLASVMTNGHIASSIILNAPVPLQINIMRYFRRCIRSGGHIVYDADLGYGCSASLTQIVPDTTQAQ